MTGTSNARRLAAMMLAIVFTLVAVMGAATVPTYAATKKPARVKGVKCVATSSSAIKITWKKAKNAKKYQVYRATSKNGKYKKVKTLKKRTFVNKGLKSGKKYFYKVRAINGKKKGKFSAKKYATTKKNSKAVVTVDKAKKTVTIYAKVNGKYFTKSTRHFMVDQNGFNKGLGILSSYCSPKDLYNGLVKAGGTSWSKTAGVSLKPGEKNTKGNAENKAFSSIDVSVSFDGETHSLSECLTTKRAGSKAPKLNMIFTGNPAAASKTKSGCMVCLDSCYIGIVANNEYGMCVIDDGNPTVYGRSDVLPEDGSVVKVIFTIK